MMTNAKATSPFIEMLAASAHEGGVTHVNAPTIVGREAMPGPMARVEGIAAVQAKSDWFYGAHEIHSVTTEGPYVNGDQFMMIFNMDITNKESGQRQKSKEAVLYTMKDAKIMEDKYSY